jgi:hypothetical protein
MSEQRDDFLPKIKETLAKRAGQRCSNPQCGRITSGPHSDSDKAINLGVASHIAAAAIGGPRYNPNQSPEERRDITNGIWLCQNCAKLIDSDLASYTDTLLIMWKRRHEASVKAELVGIRRTGNQSHPRRQLDLATTTTKTRRSLAGF